MKAQMQTKSREGGRKPFFGRKDLVLRTSIAVMMTGLAAALLMQPQDSEAREVREVSGEANFWGQDVWLDPERPFLFYGEERKDRRGEREAVGDGVKKNSEAEGARKTEAPEEGENLAIFPADGIDRAVKGSPLTHEAEARGLAELKAVETVAGIKEVLAKRLDTAVMHPTPEAIGLYLQANAFLMQKAGDFAESWRRSLVNNPRFDWTAVRPAVNTVASSISKENEGRMLRTVRRLAGDIGFVFFADASVKTRHLLRQVREFVTENGFETAYVAVDDEALAMMPEARPDRGVSRITAGGLTQFPALVMVRRSENDPARAKLVATGAADAMTLARNTLAAAWEADEALVREAMGETVPAVTAGQGLPGGEPVMPVAGAMPDQGWLRAVLTDEASGLRP